MTPKEFASIKIYTDPHDRWFIEMATNNGSRMETWGPYADLTNCVYVLDMAAKHLRELTREYA